MSECILVLKLADAVPEAEVDYYGCDGGALVLALQGIRMKAAIGDFDSVKPEELRLIEQFTDEMISLNPVKDDSDSEHAVRFLLEKGYEKIHVYGSIGGRFDHAYVNLRLIEQYAPFLVFHDKRNRIMACGEGSYSIKKDGFRYFSLFALEDSVVTLQKMKYPLQDRFLTTQDIYTLSNEIQGETGVVIIRSGKVLIIQSNDE